MLTLVLYTPATQKLSRYAHNILYHAFYSAPSKIELYRKVGKKGKQVASYFPQYLERQHGILENKRVRKELSRWKSLYTL